MPRQLTHCVQREYAALGLAAAARPHARASLLSGGERYPHLRSAGAAAAEALDARLFRRCWWPMAFDRCFGTLRHGASPAHISYIGGCVEAPRVGDRRCDAVQRRESMR